MSRFIAIQSYLKSPKILFIFLCFLRYFLQAKVKRLCKNSKESTNSIFDIPKQKALKIN